MRIAVVSDVHANLEALEAVLARSRAEGATCAWVLGDWIGYGAQPNEVVARLAEVAERAVAGNHDLAALGRFDLSWFHAAAAESIVWTAERLCPDARAALGRLDPLDVAEEGLLVHGSPRDPVSEYILDATTASAGFAARDFRVGFFGHTHLPSRFVLGPEGRVAGGVLREGERVRLRGGERFLLNPGSVGQPRDGDPRAAFLLYDRAAGEVTLRRVPYPVERAQRAILAAGLPRWFAERLAVGR